MPDRHQALMRTRCPACNTVFRVTSNQLRAKAGKVRCGYCKGIFNALDQLIDDAPAASPLPTETPAPAAEHQVAADPESTLEAAAQTAETGPIAEPLRERIHAELEQAYAQKEELAGAAWMRQFEKAVLLQVLDSHWREHLAAMDYLRQGIHLRGYAQKNPKQEYKREAFEMFQALVQRIHQEAIGFLVRARLQTEPEPIPEPRRPSPAALHFEHAAPSTLVEGEAEADGSGIEIRHQQTEETPHLPFVREGRKIGRNEPCPCGSGKKYKQCHGQLD